MTAFWITDTDLDREQRLAVKGVSLDDSFLLKGPAGSGKTNILLLRAKWLKLQLVSDFKIIVFTSSLRTFIKGGCAQYGIPEEDVITANQFFRDLLSEYNISYELVNDFDKDRKMLAEKTKKLINDKKISNIFDALLVDESQDYMDVELENFRKLTTRLMLAADSRQSIYTVTNTPNMLESLVNNNIVLLKHHYRSGLSICNVADGILRDPINYPPISGECLYDESLKPSSVAVDDYPSIDAQFLEIIRRLPNQLSLYPGERIGVFFPKRDQVAAFSTVLEKSTLADADRIWVDTLHGVKGWEFRAVHIAGCEAIHRMGPVQRRLTYTAILRAKTSVNIYYTQKLPGYLETAVAALSPPPDDSELSDLFGA